ncbi:hypothetical protein BGZ65_007137 [Modicella reniformis]|uniref:Uncharacterized protein n=1 Tax=Modicella reniformis TaxID=1440133 RepID=A0A9P6IKE6_9FUNG|nr:hypothetical protein BGZ65_007137 [Modicella reniformis]
MASVYSNEEVPVDTEIEPLGSNDSWVAMKESSGSVERRRRRFGDACAADVDAEDTLEFKPPQFRFLMKSWTDTSMELQQALRKGFPTWLGVVLVLQFGALRDTDAGSVLVELQQ